jgi:hypothetical protein
MDKLMLVMTLALYWAVSTGLWAAVHTAIPAEKKNLQPSEEHRTQPDLILQARPTPHSNPPCKLWSVWKN